MCDTSSPSQYLVSPSKPGVAEFVKLLLGSLVSIKTEFVKLLNV